MAICSILVCTGDQLCSVRQHGIEACEHTSWTIHPYPPESNWEPWGSRVLTAMLLVSVPSHRSNYIPRQKETKKQSILE